MTDKRFLRIGVLAGILVLTALLVSACGGGSGDDLAGAAQEAQPTQNPFVEPLPADRAEMEVAAPDGELPCGIGNVKWGHQIFQLDDFPACGTYGTDLTVYCLDANAQWADENVAGVAASTQANTISFESTQEGICGLFPSGE
jgi:hypothetical protein